MDTASLTVLVGKLITEVFRALFMLVFAVIPVLRILWTVVVHLNGAVDQLLAWWQPKNYGGKVDRTSGDAARRSRARAVNARRPAARNG